MFSDLWAYHWEIFICFIANENISILFSQQEKKTRCPKGSHHHNMNSFDQRNPIKSPISFPNLMCLPVICQHVAICCTLIDFMCDT